MNFFFTLWMAITYPLHSLFPVQIAATPHKEDRPMHPQEWDHSFSDGNLSQDQKVMCSLKQYLAIRMTRVHECIPVGCVPPASVAASPACTPTCHARLPATHAPSPFLLTLHSAMFDGDILVFSNSQKSVCLKLINIFIIVDDIFDDPVNISNSSSLGVPLNCSTSSEECAVQDDTFAIPGYLLFLQCHILDFSMQIFTNVL